MLYIAAIGIFHVSQNHSQNHLQMVVIYIQCIFFIDLSVMRPRNIERGSVAMSGVIRRITIFLFQIHHVVNSPRHTGNLNLI